MLCELTVPCYSGTKLSTAWHSGILHGDYTHRASFKSCAVACTLQVQRIPEACFVTLLMREEPVWQLPPVSAKSCEDLAEDGLVHGELLPDKPCIS